jgi:Protein of unknown function (DUF1761)
MLGWDGINFWAVVLAWVINCAVGSLWYSPMGFGKLWEKYTGIDMLKIPKEEASRSIVYVVIASAVQAVALAIVLHGLGVTTVSGGLSYGLLLWLGFTAATTVGVTLYSRRSWGYWWLNSSFFLVVMATNSVILSVWR